MGKSEEQNLRQQQSHGDENHRDSSGIFCVGCSMVLTRLVKDFSFKCLLVLILSLSILVSGIFWILPHRLTKSGFDAQEAIKLSGTLSLSSPYLFIFGYDFRKWVWWGFASLGLIR